MHLHHRRHGRAHEHGDGRQLSTHSNPVPTAATKSVADPNTATDNETLLTPQVNLTRSKGDGVPAVIPGANLT